MDWGDFRTLLDGAVVTLEICVLSLVIGVPLGLGLALIRWRGVPVLDPAAATVVSALRATPAVTLVLLVYYSLPGIGLSIPSFEAAVATLSLGTMAFCCEIWRGSLLAFPKDQLEAALAFGMPRFLRFRLIVLPQITRASLPALANEVTTLIKASPAVAVIGVVETTRAAVRIGAETYEPIPPFMVALVIYVLVIAGFILLQRLAERRARMAAP